MTVRVVPVGTVWRVEQLTPPPWWAWWRGPRWELVWLPGFRHAWDFRAAEYRTRAAADACAATLAAVRDTAARPTGPAHT